MRLLGIAVAASTLFSCRAAAVAQMPVVAVEGRGDGGWAERPRSAPPTVHTLSLDGYPDTLGNGISAVAYAAGFTDDGTLGWCFDAGGTEWTTCEYENGATGRLPALPADHDATAIGEAAGLAPTIPPASLAPAYNRHSPLFFPKAAWFARPTLLRLKKYLDRIEVELRAEARAP
ncbi:MAG: hypothetical protein AAGA56_26025, partial [Myxococcota bacterium]